MVHIAEIFSLQVKAQMICIRSAATGMAFVRPALYDIMRCGSARLFSTTLRRLNASTDTQAPHNGDPIATAEQSSKPIAVPFSSLKDLTKLDRSIYSGLKQRKLDTMTVVQERAIVPMMKTETGIVVRAKTGTGKTLAFAIPCIQAALENTKQTMKGHAQALIVAPTRDLALQIEAEFKKITLQQSRSVQRKNEIKILIGGRRNDINPRSTPAIIIATPGRLEAILRNPKMLPMFSDLKFRVYDEADRLLDQGFAPTLEVIEERLQEARQDALEPNLTLRTALFSATVDDAVTLFAQDTIGNDYEYINCVEKDAEESHENIHQGIVRTKTIKDSFEASFSYILDHMNDKDFKAIVFLPTVTGTEYYFRLLQAAKDENLNDIHTKGRKYGSRILRLHGKMSQAARDRTVRDFRRISHGVLVCTDVAARGLDFNDVSHVIQMCPSSTVADYIHKIGRTARAGARGKARIFISEPEMKFINTLQRERGIKFKDDVEYVQDPNTAQHFQRLGASEPEALEEFLKTFLGFASSVTGVYNFNKKKIIDESFALYRHILNDPSAKLRIGRLFVTEVLRLPGHEAAQYFDVPGGFDTRSSNDRRSKRTFMGDRGFRSDRGGYGKRDRNSGPRHSYGGFERRSNKLYGRRDSY